MRLSTLLAFALLPALLALSAVPEAATAWCAPRGPAFGSNRCTTTIDPIGRAPDVDDYVATLIQGERLSVAVLATAKSALLPTLRLIGPDGAEIDPGARVRRGGRVLVLRNVEVSSTGRWAVRIGSTGGTAGEYAVNFHVAAPRRIRLEAQRLGGAAPLEALHGFQAVAGSIASFSLSSSAAGARVALRELVDPSGREVALTEDAVAVNGGRTVAHVLLSGGDGEYRLGVGIDAGEASYRLVLDVKPPDRPRGRTALLDHEPFLAARDGPLDGTAGAIVRLPGARFPSIPPYASVYFGDVAGTLAAIGPYGTWLDVVPPPAPDGAIVDVTVQNPDGQAITRAAHFRYVMPVVLDVKKIEPAHAVLQQGGTQVFTITLTRAAPPLGLEIPLLSDGEIGSHPPSVQIAGNSVQGTFELVGAGSPCTGRLWTTLFSTASADVIVAPPAALASLAPGPVQMLEGERRTFTVSLEAPAPPSGIDVAISATDGLGTAPTWLHIPGGLATADFAFTAGNVRAAGKITVTSANSVYAEVTVSPPDSVDLSGWQIVQTNSARTFTIPAGTVLGEGGYLVVGRNAGKAAFETYWGRTLGSAVVYVNGADLWPNINGSETYELRAADGSLVDGPSVAMASAGGSVYRRVPGTVGGLASSWTSGSASTVANATPGSGQNAAAVPAGVYVSEFADTVGSGTFVYEYVEVFFDRLP